MSKRSSERSKSAAAYMKSKHIERTTGQCPWGCGRPVTNGGTALINHLVRCQGKRKKNGRNTVQ